MAVLFVFSGFEYLLQHLDHLLIGKRKAPNEQLDSKDENGFDFVSRILRRLYIGIEDPYEIFDHHAGDIIVGGVEFG